MESLQARTRPLVVRPSRLHFGQAGRLHHKFGRRSRETRHHDEQIPLRCGSRTLGFRRRCSGRNESRPFSAHRHADTRDGRQRCAVGLGAVRLCVLRRAGRGNQNPPETQWLTNGLKDVVAGVMWEEHRPVRQIEFAISGDAPDPSQLILEVTTNTPTTGQDNRPTWWTRAWERFPGIAANERRRPSGRLPNRPRGDCPAAQAISPELSPRGRSPRVVVRRQDRLRISGHGKPPVVTALRAFGVSTVIPLRVEIQWGLQPGQENRPFDGRIEVYNGRLGAIKPLAKSGVAMTGTANGVRPLNRAGVGLRRKSSTWPTTRRRSGSR